MAGGKVLTILGGVQVGVGGYDVAVGRGRGDLFRTYFVPFLHCNLLILSLFRFFRFFRSPMQPVSPEIQPF